MSMDLMVKAMKTKVGNPLRKLVLVKLADNASDQGECWPSYQHIADQCEISRSAVKVHVRELEKAGFLQREFRRKGELNQSNVFHLTLEGGAGADRGGAPETPPGAPENPGGGAAAAPRTSHSLEPVNEPKPTADQFEESFAKFWKCYPKKQKRVDAVKAWKKLKPDDALFSLIMQALARHCQSVDWLKANGQYVPHPATWLNGKRWEDELPPAPSSSTQSHHVGLNDIDHTAGLELDENGNYRVGGFQ